MNKISSLRKLGRSGLSVSPLGLGCMGMSYAYGPADEAENMKVLRRYLELGGNFLDTAEIYGPYANEELIGRFLKQIDRTKVVLATKFGFNLVDGESQGLDGSPQNVRRACDASLERLGVDCIDLFYQHRMDPSVPIEDTVGAMAELVAAGKVRALGLSEAAEGTLRRACAVHPIAALQTEYSLWTRDVETNGILAACRELGVAFVPYSPLGRGFLTGKIQHASDLDESDWRRENPRFAEEALKQNLEMARIIQEIAAARQCTAAQLALAWVLAQGEDMVPIPGTKRLRYLEENMGALHVVLTVEERDEIGRRCAEVRIAGERYAPEGMAVLTR